jgi:ATP-dependent helicase Lhr and Lhr-like helicase
VLASTDPAQPYGAALAWPATRGRPARNAASMVVVRAGSPLVWFDRRAHHLVVFPDAVVDPSWTTALVSLVKEDRLRSVEIRKIDGDSLVDAPNGLLDMLRAVGFVDGYRGLTFRT